MAKPYKELRKKMSRASQRRAEEKAVKLLAEMPLSTLRRALAISQVELAQKLQSKQPHISKLEQQEDMYISTLRNYIEALGGELELKAKFPKNREVKIELETI